MEALDATVAEITAQRCLCSNLRGLARALTRVYDAALRPAGVNSTQFALLTVILAQQPVVVGELARAVAADQSTLSRNLHRMQRQGWLTLTRRGSDGRQREVTLTPTGVEVFENSYPLWKRAQSSLEQELGEAVVQNLLKASAITRSTLES